ncbi:MAG: putative DNA binding domain-containing protein [Bifidobacteriaceae bacterium]|jgi:ATP-dependent DNA helicase RecG|nr:putative DNA binding domain-containing protein [Bifidobacteriaceae bacterium]
MQKFKHSLENEQIEFKREFNQGALKAVVAFANSLDGTLYIGVNDDATVWGVKDVREALPQITNSLRDNIEPDVMRFVHVKTVEVQHKQVIEITVQKGTEPPYHLKAKGPTTKGVYVRQGASSVNASTSAILSMINKSKADSFEDKVSINQELTFIKAKEIFRLKSLPFNKNSMVTLGLLNDDGLYTNLAFILSDQFDVPVKVSRHSDVTKTAFLDREEYSGSIFEQEYDIYHYLEMLSIMPSEFEGLDRIEYFSYPKSALREALMNLLVHRDYSKSTPSIIYVHADRIEFVSIGGLISNASYEMIKRGISFPRNKKLSNIFYRLGFVEAYGTGIPRIMEAYKDSPVQPEIFADESAFRLTLPDLEYAKNAIHSDKKQEQKAIPVIPYGAMSREDWLIYAVLNGNISLSKKELVTITELSDDIVRRSLEKLMLLKLVEKVGAGPKTMYRQA